MGKLATVDVRSCGACGDGATDDTDAFNRALRAAAGVTLIVPAGLYMIDAIEGIRPLSNSVLVLDDSAVLAVIPNASKHYNLIRLRDCHNVTIRGGRLTGDRHQHKGGRGEWGMGIHVGSGCKNITLCGVHAREMWGDGFYIGGRVPPKNVTIQNCIADFNRRQGLSIVSGSEIKILDNTFSNTQGTRPESGVDIEPARKGSGVYDVMLEGNRFINNRHVGIQIAGKWGPTRNITIKKNSYCGQRPLKVKHVGSDYFQSSLSELLCFFRCYRLELTDCRVP